MRLTQRQPRETGRDYALRTIKDNIIHLELAPGSMVSENELAAAMGLSRTPVREALIELSKVKIVEIYPQKGSAVALIDYDLVEESRFMRKVLECAVVELDCEMAPPEDILPWKQEEYSIYLSSIRRFARPTGWDMAGKVIYDGTTYPVYILALRNTEKHEEYPPLRENYKHVPIYRECSEDGLRLFFVIDGHSYTYSMGMMAPPEETIPQDAVDYFDGLLLAACREIIDLYS